MKPMSLGLGCLVSAVGTMVALFTLGCRQTPQERESSASSGENETSVSDSENCVEQPHVHPPEVFEAQVNGLRFIYRAPEFTKGLILFFHGGSGNRHSWRTQLEGARTLERALEAGYAFAAIDSAAHLGDPVDGRFRWSDDPSPQNPDIVNVAAMLTRLGPRGDLAVSTEALPLFAVGVSDGGTMVSRLAQYISLQAVANFVSSNLAFLDDGAVIPPIVLIAGENDSIAGGPAQSALFRKVTQQLQQPALYLVNENAPIEASALTRIPGIDCPLAQSVVESLVQAGALDVEGRLRMAPNQLKLAELLPVEVHAQLPAIAAQFQEFYGEHAVTAEFNSEIFEFFGRYPTPSLRPPTGRSNPARSSNVVRN